MIVLLPIPERPIHQLIYRSAFLLLLFLFSLKATAQPAHEARLIGERFSEDFVHGAQHLYNWHEVEFEMIKQTGMDVADCAAFFRYLLKEDRIGFYDFLAQVESGAITQNNARQYWLNKIPSYILIYNQEQETFHEQLNLMNTPAQPYTGGAICNNLDFTNGINGWSGRWNNTNNSQYNTAPALLPAAGLNSNATNVMGFVHELTTAGVDPHVPIQRVPPGHTSALRLGDDAPLTTMGPYNHQVITNKFMVTPQNDVLVYWYAVVFDQDKGQPHQQNDQPYFKIRMFDQNNVEIMCAHYDVNATSAANNGFQVQSLSTGNFGVEAVYKDWTQIMIPLINYHNTTVTIQFETSDCSQRGHFGYAYLAVDCGPFQVIQSSPFGCSAGNTTMAAPAGADTYLWTGPGIVGPNNTQQITINTPGNYSVSMSTIGNSGATCVFTIDTVITQSINIPLAAFSNNSPCLGNSSNFTDNSTGPGINSWNWNFGDTPPATSSVQNPVHTYTTAGTFNVSLIVTNTDGCSDTITQPVTIDTVPVAAFTATSPCLGNPTNFTNNSTGAGINSWSWNFGNTPPATSALQNPVYTYTVAGTYNVTLIVSNAGGCSDTIAQPITVDPVPIPAFTATSVCQGSTTTFTNTSQAANAAYLWDFNDSNTSTAQNPVHVYTNSGTFHVQLLLTTPGGCKDSITVPVTVNPNAVPSFSTSPVCEGMTTSFNNQTPSSPAIASWAWDFNNDGTTDNTSANPTNLYNNGTYTALLTVTTAASPACTASYSAQIVVHPNPVANFTANPVCQGAATVFNNNTSGIATPDIISFYNWNFGDNNNTSGSNPAHIYTSCGTYISTLILVSNNNCTASYSDTIVVNCTPQVVFTAPAVCLQTPTIFTNSSSVATGSIANWSWDFNNDNVVDNTTQSPAYTYPLAGTYTVELTVTSGSGCTHSQTVPVEVYPLPLANFSYSHTCFGSPTSFTNLSQISSGSVTGWSWDFDNNGTTDNTSPSPVNTLSPAGLHQVHLSIISDHHCPDDTLIPVYINPRPVPMVTLDDPDGCPVHHVNLSGGVTATSVNHPNSIVKWEWDVDNDGAYDVSNSYNPGSNTDLVPHNYINNDHYNPKIYAVTLTVTSDSGCAGSITSAPDFIRVFPQPIAAFSWGPNDPLPDIYAPYINFVNEAQGATIMHWHFGDTYCQDSTQNVSTAFNPTHNYEYWVSTIYNVSQWVSNVYGCTDSIIHPVEILPNWTFYIPNAFTPNQDHVNDGFRGTGINIHDYKLWIFDRWGNMLFHSTDLDEYWDGKVKNNPTPVQEDVYVWKVKFIDIFGHDHEQTGTVTVVR